MEETETEDMAEGEIVTEEAETGAVALGAVEVVEGLETEVAEADLEEVADMVVVEVAVSRGSSLVEL